MKRSFILLTFVSILSLFTTVHAQEKPKPYAVVMFATGEVQVFHKGEDNGLALQRGDAVQLGDRVTTGEESKLTLVTQNRKIINLPGKSELTTDSSNSTTAIAGLGLGMFKSAEGRSDVGAQAAVRAKDRTILLKYPRYGFIRDKNLVLDLEPLESGQSYHIKIISTRQPRFIYETTIQESSFPINKETVGNEIRMGQPYWISVDKINMRDKPLQSDFDELAVVMIAPETRVELENAEKELQAMEGSDPSNIAYPTLLAETYEAFELYHEAISVYETIYHQLAPGDEYSRLRLKDLYAMIKDPVKYQTVLKSDDKSARDN